MEESHNNQQDLLDLSSNDSDSHNDWWSLTESSTESTMSDDLNLSESSFAAEEHLSPEFYSCTKEESESIIESLNQMLENSNTNSAMGDVLSSFGFW